MERLAPSSQEGLKEQKKKIVGRGLDKGRDGRSSEALFLAVEKVNAAPGRCRKRPETETKNENPRGGKGPGIKQHSLNAGRRAGVKVSPKGHGATLRKLSAA